jgi:hypothetical protein
MFIIRTNIDKSIHVIYAHYHQTVGHTYIYVERELLVVHPE